MALNKYHRIIGLLRIIWVFGIKVQCLSLENIANCAGDEQLTINGQVLTTMLIPILAQG